MDKRWIYDNIWIKVNSGLLIRVPMGAIHKIVNRKYVS